MTHGAWMDFDINDYDVVFQNYCARLCFDGYVSEHYQNALMNFRGLKILAVQDDYDRTATLHRAIRRLGFHVLLTCIQSEFWPLVYPKSELARSDDHSGYDRLHAGATSGEQFARSFRLPSARPG